MRVCGRILVCRHEARVLDESVVPLLGAGKTWKVGGLLGRGRGAPPTAAFARAGYGAPPTAARRQSVAAPASQRPPAQAAEHHARALMAR